MKRCRRRWPSRRGCIRPTAGASCSAPAARVRATAATRSSGTAASGRRQRQACRLAQLLQVQQVALHHPHLCAAVDRHGRAQCAVGHGPRGGGRVAACNRGTDPCICLARARRTGRGHWVALQCCALHCTAMLVQVTLREGRCWARPMSAWVSLQPGGSAASAANRANRSHNTGFMYCLLFGMPKWRNNHHQPSLYSYIARQHEPSTSHR